MMLCPIRTHTVLFTPQHNTATCTLLPQQPWRPCQQTLRRGAPVRATPDDTDSDAIPLIPKRRKRMDWIIGPSYDLSRDAAVQLQLQVRPRSQGFAAQAPPTQALRDNNTPYIDHGVEVLYRFADLDPFVRSRFFGPSLDLGQVRRSEVVGSALHKVVSTVGALPAHHALELLSRAAAAQPRRVAERARGVGGRVGAACAGGGCQRSQAYLCVYHAAAPGGAV